MVKRNLLKRLLSIALISTMLLAGCGSTLDTDSAGYPAPADDKTQAGEYSGASTENAGSTDAAITEENITIRGYDGDDPVVVIPEAIDGKTVTCINSNSFDGEDILAIRIP